jgi:CopG family nickel-responsive transcriptional regulator
MASGILGCKKNMAHAAISIPRDLLEQFDCIIREKDYFSRSDAIQDAVRHYIKYYEWMNEIKGERAGTIIVLYDRVKRGLIGSIAQLQQDFKEIICSTLLVPVNNSENARLELLILKGDGKLLVALAEQMLRLNGVKYVRLTTIEHGAEDNSTNAVSPGEKAEEAGKVGLQDVKDELLLAAESMDMTGNHLRKAIEKL